MYNLCKLLKDWENYGHSNMRSRNFHNYRLLIVETFESGDSDFPDKETVVKFCNKWVEDMAQHPFGCMSDYYLFDEDNNELVKCYKSKSVKFSVTEVFPDDFDLIQIDDECIVNLEHCRIQFSDGKTYSWDIVDYDGLALRLINVWTGNDIVVVKL